MTRLGVFAFAGFSDSQFMETSFPLATTDKVRWLWVAKSPRMEFSCAEPSSVATRTRTSFVPAGSANVSDRLPSAGSINLTFLLSVLSLDVGYRQGSIEPRPGRPAAAPSNPLE